jgi:HD-GYP domain-containing protein (c-di-GMP phosphodiesterase class II)
MRPDGTPFAIVIGMQVPNVTPLVTLSEGLRFHPAPLVTLRPDMDANFELYLGIGTPVGRRYVLYKSRDYDLTEDRRQYLIKRGVTALYVTEEDLHAYFGYVDRAVGTVLASEHTPPREKSQILYQTTASLVSCLFERPDSPVLLRSNQKMVSHMVKFLASDTRLLRATVAMFCCDYSLYHHAVNVATISTGVALQMGYKPGRELEQLGQGFLFHDIGKCQLPTELLKKPGALTASEMAEMQRHPQYGTRQMRGREKIEAPTLEVILHHHEKLSGHGYPDKLGEGEITMPARICAVADIFDALTSHRSYKAGLSGFEALKLMQAEMTSELDSECLLAMISLLGPSKR